MQTRVLLMGALLVAAGGCSSSSGGTTPTDDSDASNQVGLDASGELDATTRATDSSSGNDSAEPAIDAKPAGDGADEEAAALDGETSDSEPNDAGSDSSLLDSSPTDGAPDATGLAGDSGTDAADAAQSFSVSGHLAGLTVGESIVLQDNASDNLTLNANGDFSFPAPVANGGNYAVTILTYPTSPIAQTCSVVKGGGAVQGAPVNGVQVQCDMLAYYPFTGNANDASGYGNNANVTNGMLVADHSGGANGAYEFTGHGYVDAPEPTGFLPSGNSARTLTAWIEPTLDQSEWGIVTYGTGNCTSKMFGIGRQSSGVTFWSGCNDVQSSLPFPINAWTFIAMVYGGNDSITIYANGQTVTANISNLATPTSGDIIMGADLENAVTFTGVLDSVRVYGHALTAAEIQSIYTSAAP